MSTLCIFFLHVMIVVGLLLNPVLKIRLVYIKPGPAPKQQSLEKVCWFFTSKSNHRCTVVCPNVSSLDSLLDGSEIKLKIVLAVIEMRT